jgi:hypothetical protein
VGGRHRRPPLMPASFVAALRDVNLMMNDSLVWQQSLGPSGSQDFIVLFPGLSRLCTVPAWMDSVLRPCVLGRAAMLFLLQHPSERAAAKCHAILQRAASREGSRCNIVLATQSFTDVPDGPCGGHGTGIQKQAFAVSRAHQWATTFFPQPRFYVRVRIDDTRWCLPQTWPSSAFVGLESVTSVTEVSTGAATHRAGDQYALVPASLSEVYFDRWRVWEEVNCSYDVRAGGLHAESMYHLWPDVYDGGGGTHEGSLTMWMVNFHGRVRKSTHLSPNTNTEDNCVSTTVVVPALSIISQACRATSSLPRPVWQFEWLRVVDSGTESRPGGSMRLGIVRHYNSTHADPDGLMARLRNGLQPMPMSEIVRYVDHLAPTCQILGQSNPQEAIDMFCLQNRKAHAKRLTNIRNCSWRPVYTPSR